MLIRDRQRRVAVIEALERQAKQFRSRDDSWPFRMPHEPLDLDALIESVLDGEPRGFPAAALKTRGVLSMEWPAGETWDLWVVTLPSGIHLFCDSDGHESRALASARRGNPSDADGFFLERLAESRGHLFGIEMAGPPPARVKASIGDRGFLADVFVELFEGTDAERAISAEGSAPGADGASDFHAVVVAWLGRVLSAPPMTRRQPRVRDEDPSAL